MELGRRSYVEVVEGVGIFVIQDYLAEGRQERKF